jgi:hypothetical protein
MNSQKSRAGFLGVSKMIRNLKYSQKSKILNGPALAIAVNFSDSLKLEKFAKTPKKVVPNGVPFLQ